MESKGNFPDCKNNKSTGAKAPGEKSRNKNNGRKHHHMVPVENAAGGAAAVVHDQPEGTPDENTDQITYIKNHSDQKKNFPVIQPGKIAHAYQCDQHNPHQHHLESRLGGIGDIVFHCFQVHLFHNGPEVFPEKLQRADGQVFMKGPQLGGHIHQPHAPQKMQQGEPIKKHPPFQHMKLPRQNKIQHNSCHQNQHPANKPQGVPSSDGRHFAPAKFNHTFSHVRILSLFHP